MLCHLKVFLSRNKACDAYDQMLSAIFCLCVSMCLYVCIYEWLCEIVFINGHTCESQGTS